LRETKESAGSQDPLDVWVTTTWPRAVVYARSLLRDRGLAEDVVQDCFCSLLRKSADYDLARDGVPLLMKAITHACWKKNARARPMVSLHTTGDGDATDAGEPPRVVLRAELERAISAALAELPENQRAAIELKGLGHSQQEIAEILDVSPSNAGVLIHRGRQAMAQKLAPYLENRPDEQSRE